jgi:gamma-glutamyltranspeptidase/glutathione hydrolase
VAIDPTSAARGTRRRDAPVLSRRGLIGTAHPLSSSAGLRVLADGGNAVDAAVAAALVDSVVLPQSCGIGGDLFAIVHRPGTASGDLLAFMGSGIGPRNTTIDYMREHGEQGGRVMAQTGPLSPAVPGMVAGLFSLLEHFGTKSFRELAEPAIGYAGGGYPLTPGGARAIATHRALLSRYPSSAAVFLPGGQVPAPGTMLKQTDLARTIEQIAAGGPDTFYKGKIAKGIGRFLAENGGVLDADDFADHETDVAPPLASTYQGYTIYETRLPTQGFIVLEALNILEHADLAAYGVGSAAGIHLAAEALKLAFADRLEYAADPRVHETPIDMLISKPHAERRFNQIDPERAATEIATGALVGGDTTYLCAVDGDGLMISLIFSVSGGFGSGVVAGDTGVVLNNRAGHCFSLVDGHPNIFAPGKKTMHTLNCYLIADPEGQPVLVGGTPGGDSQPQWNVQTITGLIDAGLDVQAAIEQPRWMVYPGTYPAEVGNPFQLRIESRIGAETVNDLQALGHDVVSIGPWGASGSVQAISRDPETGVLAGGSDPRSDGLAIGL